MKTKRCVFLVYSHTQNIYLHLLYTQNRFYPMRSHRDLCLREVEEERVHF